MNRIARLLWTWICFADVFWWWILLIIQPLCASISAALFLFECLVDVNAWMIYKNLILFHNSRIKKMKSCWVEICIQLFRPSNQKLWFYIVYIFAGTIVTCILKQIQTTTAHSLNNGVADVSLSRRTNKVNELLSDTS